MYFTHRHAYTLIQNETMHTFADLPVIVYNRNKVVVDVQYFIDALSIRSPCWHERANVINDLTEEK